MVNYFNLPKVVAILWEFMVGVVCVARFFPGWLCQYVKEIDNIVK